MVRKRLPVLLVHANMRRELKADISLKVKHCDAQCRQRRSPDEDCQRLLTLAQWRVRKSRHHGACEKLPSTCQSRMTMRRKLILANPVNCNISKSQHHVRRERGVGLDHRLR